ncbi:hypothetical protein SAMN05216387_103105 [Nitrosovibrio tenuis]|uniref:Uncharacterized protein n=1 Tax=Nitrosovibrio tenuis TaxID=1233 RepID=A0A1H7K4I8_9PROT|nr:hypothetical protein SAMN05216387_103105 [Nitrosovibrio tenuis]
MALLNRSNNTAIWKRYVMPFGFIGALPHETGSRAAKKGTDQLLCNPRVLPLWSIRSLGLL